MPEKRLPAKVLDHALVVPATNKLHGKRFVLASASPRRKEILETFGLRPEIVPSEFAEDLPHTAFDNLYEYATATATEKAVEVYKQLVNESPDHPPDMVIGADTIVLSHIVPPRPGIQSTAELHDRPEVLEKPGTKDEKRRMLLDLNGKICEVVTGISVVFPILTAPGYGVKSMEERTLVHFANNSKELIEAYVQSGEGIDRAGGFAVQGLGGMLIAKVDGDYNNVVGFPGASFFRFLNVLIKEEDDFLDV
ncbi:Maf/Ham1 [Auriculariales sp. MPI-PUGE-AT-0066]|nr:Maf/Ham1 [Auriculariales sp. MPI-PUGE-AT-0066]